MIAISSIYMLSGKWEELQACLGSVHRVGAVGSGVSLIASGKGSFPGALIITCEVGISIFSVSKSFLILRRYSRPTLNCCRGTVFRRALMKTADSVKLS